MNMIHDFFTLLESFREYDAPLIESIHEGMIAIFEARALPDIELVQPDAKLKHHQFKLTKDESTNKTYLVAVRDGSNKLVGMVVQFTLKYPSMGMWMCNFVQKGQTDFNATGTGSLDGFNSVFSVIRYFIETESPKFICYKATDDNGDKTSQKSRLYGSYLKMLGGKPMGKLPPTLAHLDVLSF